MESERRRCVWKKGGGEHGEQGKTKRKKLSCHFQNILFDTVNQMALCLIEFTSCRVLLKLFPHYAGPYTYFTVNEP